ncbi:MAG: DUF6352 family protein [Alphaproteobacteria bacterium]|nr:DUF6352 family protein [Alphaproteobacteria bacterium]
MTRDFWRSSGYHLLDRTPEGRLAVTDDFLRAYIARPEMRPVEESCAAEIALHDALLSDPRQAVLQDRLASLTDPDARENYDIVLRFRDHLLSHESVEGAYLALFRSDGVTVPPLFIDQLVHVILHHLLQGTDDPLRLRAAEPFFRSQRLTQRDGAIMLADEDTVEMYAQTGGLGSLGQLLQESNTPSRTIELDVLDDRNKALYWDRSDAFDTVLDISFTRPGLDAFCRVMEDWIEHMTSVRTRVQPVERITDERWVWHIGLDVEATAILNDLYNGAEVDDQRLAQLVSLFRLEFSDPSEMMPSIAGRPVYLGMAITPQSVLRLKPQNLLFNLPLAEQS